MQNCIGAYAAFIVIIIIILNIVKIKIDGTISKLYFNENIMHKNYNEKQTKQNKIKMKYHP